MEHHRKNREVFEGCKGFDYWLGQALHQVFAIGATYHLHVADAMIAKLAFNRQREDHKIEHRRAVGGKAY
jgi:hypothetical protein